MFHHRKDNMNFYNHRIKEIHKPILLPITLMAASSMQLQQGGEVSS
jgi:hypothetical protein